MPTRKSGSKGRNAPKGQSKVPHDNEAGKGTTVSGPSHPNPAASLLADQAAEQSALAGAIPFNAAKPKEYAPADPTDPPQGPHEEMPSETTGASTLSEANESAKTAVPARAPKSLEGDLASKRVNSAGQALTSNQGVPIASNQDSLKAR
jgi:catalase